MIRRFLYQILLFCLPLLGLWISMETICRLKHEQLFTEPELDNVFGASARSYAWVGKLRHPEKILLTGSSSIKYGLSCTTLNKLSKDSLLFLNLAADARDPIETYFILKHLDLGNVRSVYMGIDPWIYTRAYYRNRNPYLYLDLDFLTAFRYSRQMDTRTLPRRYSALLRSLLKLNTTVQADSRVPAGLGSASLARRPVNFNDPVSEKFMLKDYGWSRLQFQYLAKIIRLCKEKGISFYAFYPPKRNDFILDYAKHGSEIQASFMEQWKSAGISDEIRGSFSDLPDPGQENHADAYHLSTKGQVKYSVYFYNNILQR